MIHRLRAIQLAKTYKTRPVVQDVSFEITQGEVVGLLGPNGAGKTTSFHMVIGLVVADSGQVIYEGQDITRWPMHQRARAGIAYLPQESSVFRTLSVRDNIYCVLETLRMSRADRHERLRELLTDFSIESIADQKGYTLSGGECRRVEVARALALNPRFLLLDEPFAGIDPIAVSDIQRMIQVLKKRQIGVLITDHNVRETLEICDIGYILSDGKIIVKGTPTEIIQSKIARQLYLGENFQV